MDFCCQLLRFVLLILFDIHVVAVMGALSLFVLFVGFLKLRGCRK